MLLLLLLGGGILEARLEAAVDSGKDVAVRLAYRLEAKGIDRIGFSVLEVDGVAIEEVSAFASGDPLPLDLEPRSGPKREGFIGIPNETKALELRYVVRGGAAPTEEGLRVRLPCAVLDLELEETRTGLFTSTVELPEGLSVVDGFPAQAIAGPEGTYRWELPLVPTFVSFRAASGTVLLTPARVATTAVILLLLAMGFVGFRKARACRT